MTVPARGTALDVSGLQRRGLDQAPDAARSRNAQGSSEQACEHECQEVKQPGAIGLPRRLYRATPFGLRVLETWELARQRLAWAEADDRGLVPGPRCSGGSDGTWDSESRASVDRHARALLDLVRPAATWRAGR
jgi:hypothetical protein